MRVLRVFERKREATAFSGEGARLYGGRWNTPGTPIVYASSSLALAILEIMANARRRIPPGYAYTTMDIPDDVRTEAVDSEDLPTGWFKAPAPSELQAIGDAWIRAAPSFALLVPSAIARIEMNVLLNPAHLDYSRITIGATADIPIDSRLVSQRPGATRKAAR